MGSSPKSFFKLRLVCLVGLLTAQSANGLSINKLLDHPASWDSLADNALSIVAGYHVIYSWPGGAVPQELYDLTKEGKVGGVIIFGENVNDDLPDQIAKLQDVYKQSPGYIGKPLLIVTDQEGGEVVRLPGGPTMSEKDVGASANPPAAARRAGIAAAKACKAYNVNGESTRILSVLNPD